jgi:hypothetical protein
MNKNKEKRLFAEILTDENISINSIAEMRDILLNHEDISLRSSMAYFVATYKITELQNEVVEIACSEKAKNHSAVFIFASHQFSCSQYFKVYIALLLQRSFHSSLACFNAIKKCKNISPQDFCYAKEALESWYYFHNTPQFTDSEIVAKRNLIYKICKYL